MYMKGEMIYLWEYTWCTGILKRNNIDENTVSSTNLIGHLNIVSNTLNNKDGEHYICACAIIIQENAHNVNFTIDIRL